MYVKEVSCIVGNMCLIGVIPHFMQKATANLKSAEVCLK
jgi:hypothetical protein